MATRRRLTPEEAAEHAQLVLCKGARAQWWRRCGSSQTGFWYETAQGSRITDEKQLARIQALAIPPGYRDVRICPSARGRLQAVCIDSAGRLQYRYHADYVTSQAAKKYAKIEHFGERLPTLRQLTNEHIFMEGLCREKVLAVVVRLINDLYFRLGSEESVERYKTFGVTTLRNRHLKIKPGGELVFDFVGKHHIQQRRILVDESLAEVVQQIKAVKGPRLFMYVDAEGKSHPIKAQDVNNYIKSAVGSEFSAKDFRTWGGTLLAAVALADMGKAPNEKKAHKNIVAATKLVAERLGNTPTVCRNSYIHPVVFTRYLESVTLDDFRPRHQRHISRHQPDYHPEELALMRLFRSAETQAKAA